MMDTVLSESERERYTRQILVDGWGEEGQIRLKSARVGITGAGGLGSPVATYLTAAGIGELVICDYQDLELSNLNRQVMHNTGGLGMPKIESAADFLSSLNPLVSIKALKQRITMENAEEALGGCDLIVDCLDNWPTRFTLNALAVRKGLPFLHGGIREHWGQFALLNPPNTACLSCFLTEPDDEDGNNEPIPVYGAVAGVLGSMMVTAALRHLCGIEPDGMGELRLFDGVSMTLESVPLLKRQDCPVCGGS